jgi:hypothetical protein
MLPERTRRIRVFDRGEEARGAGRTPGASFVYTRKRLSRRRRRCAWSRRMRRTPTPRPRRTAPQERRRGGSGHRSPRLGSRGGVDVVARIYAHSSTGVARVPSTASNDRLGACFSWTKFKIGRPRRYRSVLSFRVAVRVATGQRRPPCSGERRPPHTPPRPLPGARKELYYVHCRQCSFIVNHARRGEVSPEATNVGWSVRVLACVPSQEIAPWLRASITSCQPEDQGAWSGTGCCGRMK